MAEYRTVIWVSGRLLHPELYRGASGRCDHLVRGREVWRLAGTVYAKRGRGDQLRFLLSENGMGRLREKPRAGFFDALEGSIPAFKRGQDLPTPVSGARFSDFHARLT